MSDNKIIEKYSQAMKYFIFYQNGQVMETNNNNYLIITSKEFKDLFDWNDGPILKNYAQLHKSKFDTVNPCDKYYSLWLWLSRQFPAE